MGSSKKNKFTFSFSSIPTPNPYHQHEARRPSQASSQKNNNVTPTRDGSPSFGLSGETKVSHDDGSIQKATAQSNQSATDPDQEQPHPKGPRYTYRDHKGILRELWQPGDPDGQRDSEYPDNNIFTCRWRFFQSNVDHVKHCDWPPKYVVLDDKAAHAVFISGAYNQKERRKYWPFDFNYHGNIRIGRPNRGRPAIVGEGEGDKLDLGHGQGDNFIGWSIAGERSSSEKRYHFTGERTGWTEITFKPYTASKTTAKADEPENKTPDEVTKRKAENEYFNNKPVMNPRHKRQKVGPYLHSTPSPEWSVRDRSRLAYASKTPYLVFEEEEDESELTGGAEESPRADTGRMIEYAGMSSINESLFPERVGGRIVQSRILTGAQTPHAGAGGGTRALWQSVKDLESGLIQSRETLKFRDQEISELKKRLGASEKSNDEGRQTLKARDAEIKKLRAELKGLRKT